MQIFLFPIRFETKTINSHIINWLNEHEIDYFFKYDVIYADIFGIDVYYRLESVHVCDTVHEIYYDPDRKELLSSLERKYPLGEKIHRIPALINSVKVTFENGDSIITQIRGDKNKIESFYLNHIFNIGDTNDNLQKAIKVEFLSVHWK